MNLGKLNECVLNFEQVLDLKFEEGMASIKIWSDEIVEFRVGIESQDFSSKAVENVSVQPVDIHYQLLDNTSQSSERVLKIETAKLCIKVYDNFYVDIYDKDGKMLCEDYRGSRNYTPPLSERSLKQLAAEGHFVARGDYNYNIQVVKKMQGDEAFYGLGDKTGFLNKYGYSYEMWNTDNPDPQVDCFKVLYKSIPFFITLRENCVYGIFFDNTYHSYFDMGKESPEYYFFGTDKGNLDYYFIGGQDMAAVLANYTYLTGRVPMPQLWTLGYHQSKWGYESAEDILDVAQKFRKYQIPCDTIHLDIDYMDHFKVFTWNDEAYKPKGQLTKEMAELGFKLVSIIDPGVKVEQDYAVYEEGVKNDYFIKTPEGEIYENVVWPGVTAFPDFGNEKVQAWWSNNTKFLIDSGIRGIWNDMNEPASFRGELPQDVVFSWKEGESSTHAKMHNVYGHLMSKATYEGLKKYDGRRPFVITRACYAGSQKYSTAWTGDNHSIWAHLQMAVPQLCNLGLSGMAYVGTDIGGFGSDTTPELLSRWIEVGCFSPLCRNHSCKGSIYQEPWRFDEQTLTINRKYISLRYRLLPYFYDLFRELELKGLPILRPLVLHYQNDPEVKNCNDEFMVGEHILVAPVLEQGKTMRMVYLPEGIWYDYWTKEEVQGNQYILREAPIDVCPIYVKAGSILPNYPLQQYIGEKEIKTLELDVYPGDGVYIHYQDNGSDFAYQQGEYNLYEICHQKGQVTVKLIYHGYQDVYENMDILGMDKLIEIEKA
ncbi:MAG: glycoside hydrolase family 31 protein [Lachnospiraceae bacterium]